MKFYFPDSQDLVSPTYDFVHDEYSPLRVRQRDDRYAHEVLSAPAYDGILVSKAIVDGSVSGPGKYSMPQRQRLYRLGVRGFFRLPDGVETLGDCGAFNYVNEPEPPYSVDEVLDFYEQCGFEAGVSIDHIILGYQRPGLINFEPPDEWVNRRRISLRYAEAFIAEAKKRKSSVEPVGAAQGWDPASYADSVKELQRMGYKRIALGGMVPLKTPDILDCLKEIDKIRRKSTKLHLLGITRVDSIESFASYGVSSFDSTSSFRQSFMDDRDNYHTATTTYAAIRVPQVDGNVTLKRAVLSGKVAQAEAVKAERECLARLRAFDRGACTVDEALAATIAYENVVGVKKTYDEQYRRTLEHAPWKACQCGLCAEHGIEMAIFRGTERNKRRGFHNLSVLAEKMSVLPCRATKRKGKHG
ncbi:MULTISPECIES: tRNA-guanine transglycosylase DpdA [Rhodococcus]|uniref:tRNA-guanine transglycosylase DpdA n=1 Tax=Rhodococcus oxybenzonivorans TaxID=1990687 RepID=A0AAE4V093_9NOCA|nr:MULTISPECIES: tRNA-guanine transglycosylase DpdA [Rhodococcus]MDV7245317.1 tRNA-guanine transglycosylase DpdA [Rhodococcus oxybenzonivorans]MDV7266110.1 tRNA-guanine transglycosylase DpdA [Rhodococcus oxybenzonivorans]MDV7272403.1 tRNA-guanine transglycosylase DpdA [Rhodococcus oxybenzonivorans]MDV7336342.1 tRNA-guanine transglycosylase DpdA [Rhodococcus oxybenzonivorans]MDV7347642.1 tRNA-guanine transglycosylase DpdA [Rhodococcus oxybenzonivorans]